MISFMVEGEGEKRVFITEAFEDQVTFVIRPRNDGSICVTFNIYKSSRMLVNQIINSSLEGSKSIYEVGFSARSWKIDVYVSCCLTSRNIKDNSGDPACLGWKESDEGVQFSPPKC